MKKKIYFISLLFLMVNNLNAQNFENNFLGEDFLFYKGVLLKLNPNPMSGFSNVFYSSLNSAKIAYDNNVIYPDTKYYFNTVADSLMNRIFLVEDIIDKPDDSLKSSSLYFKPIFVLSDTLTKQKIYFKYDTKYDFNFPFVTSVIKLDQDYYCLKIERIVDDFTSEVKFNSPLINNSEISSVTFHKYINKTKSVYYLSLQTHGPTAVVDGNGVTIIFTDGTRWSRNVKIDVDVDNGGFSYSAFLPLTQADLIIFSSKKIKKFRLYIFDEDVNPFEGDKFKIYFNCIKKAKL